MRKSLKRVLFSFIALLLILYSFPLDLEVSAATNCPAPEKYSAKAQEYIDFYNIPIKSSNGKPLSEKYLLIMPIDDKVIVYGCASDVSNNDFDLGEYRYLGWDVEGNLYRNWKFRSDSRATLNVAKNWVKAPWDTQIGISKQIVRTGLSRDPDAVSWLERITDPYKESPTFLQSYNKRKNTNWTGETLREYAIIQQKPTKFSPGVVQMWNIWQPDGSWWYEMFTIPAEKLNPPPEKPDLIITNIVTDPTSAASGSWVGDNVNVKITSKNQGKVDSGAFTVGIVGTNIKSEVISNISPGQIKTVTVKVSSAVSGIIKYTAMTDFGRAVAESNEDNNTMPFQIVFSKKNEPTTPIAVISHKDGDHRTEPEITIKPSVDPKLDDILSYSPGKEAITVREWKYKTPSGTTIQKKPVAKDFVLEGEYLVELRVTNSAKKISEWAQLIINVGELATPKPSATPEPTPTPRPELKVGIKFVPDKILAGETSTLYNTSDGFDTHEWTFSSNLDPIFTDKSKYEYYDQTFTQPGTYRATIKVSDSSGFATADATLTVIDPKPIAVVTGATKVIEGRPFPFPYHLNNSYTPLADRGATIDHSKDEKRFKKIDASSYTLDFPTINNLALGDYLFQGKVYDTTGRVSDWADLKVEVVPDLPPTVEVIAPAETYRNNGFMLYIEAESPDYDTLDHLLLEERYDANDNGNFEEESWKTLYDGAYKTTHQLNYTTVGKRQYRAKVTENYGKFGVSALVTTDVLNYAPSVNFNAFGTTQQPGQDEDSGPPVTNYTAQSIFRSWTVKKPYVGGNGDKIAWKSDATSISTKIGQMVNFNLKYPEAGEGANSRNKYSLASDLVAKKRWSVQPNSSNGLNNTQLATNIIFNNNRLYTRETVFDDYAVQDGDYFSTHISVYFTERDAVTGNAINPTFTFGDKPSGQGFIPELKGDEKFYYYEINNKTTLDFNVYNKTGKKEDSHSIDLVDLQNRGVSVTMFELMPDFKSVIIGINYGDTNSMNEIKYYKYLLESKTVEWVANGPLISRFEGTVNYTLPTVMTVGSDGSIYMTGKTITKITPNGARVDSAVISGHAGGSAVSLSNDGQYLYFKNFGEQKDNYQKVNYFQVYQTSDLSRVAIYTMDQTSISEVQNTYSVSPIVQKDGTVVTVEANTIYYFTKTGTLLNKKLSWATSNITHELYSAGLLNTGEVMTGYYGVYDYYYGLVKPNTDDFFAKEPNSDSSMGYSGTGLVTVTPVLPNGSVFIIDQSRYPYNITAFVSASGNTTLQDIDANTVGIFDDNWGGLLYDATSIMKNYAFEFNVSVNDVKNDKPIGAGFNIQNEKSLNAIEWTKDTLTLYKVVNGAKTSLKSIPLARSAYVTYPVKVESINGVLAVYINHAKVIEVADATYTKGAAGLMSLGQSSASFSNVKKTNYGDMYTQQTYDSVLVNDPISYEKLFSDIENDPMGIEEWSYSHNPNFFENPEGLSIHNGKTYGSTINALEKPGVYEITFRAQDKLSLSSYNKWSEPLTKLLYVHRRPVAQPDVRFTGKVFAEGEALDYETFDTSYDPDISHILSDKLFRTRWADETKWTEGKRTYYNRAGVELIVQEQVRDIHGAWSYWGQTIVYKDKIPVVNQTKPVMTITVPAGLTAAAPTVLIKEPTIKWTYYDKENDPQESYRLTLTYVDNNETALYIEHEGNALTYPMIADSIVPGRVVKVQGQVYSAGVWSDLSNIRYFVLDLPPDTFLLSFNGPDGANPVYTNNNRPQLRVFTVDPENHPITAIDYEVYLASSGARVVDTNSLTAATSYTPSALAEGLHYWKARSNDSYLWGNYSTNGFFFVDTVKPADVDEKLEILPTAVTVKFNAFNDAEPSSGHASRTFYLQKVNANGSVTNIDLNGDGTAEYSVPLALNKQSYTVTGLVPGQEYRLTVIDYDIAGNEGHYEYIHFVTNRPPEPDFDWTPKPIIWESQTIKLVDTSKDPDGDPIASWQWVIVDPTGASTTSTIQKPTITLAKAGTYKVSLNVCDDKGLCSTSPKKKDIVVLPISITGEVYHTDKWLENLNKFNAAAEKAGRTKRPLWYFFPGERFMLRSNTTGDNITRVDAILLDKNKAVTTYSTNMAGRPDVWNGSLWSKEMINWETQDLYFKFILTTDTGFKKESALVKVRIEDEEYWRQHGIK